MLVQIREKWRKKPIPTTLAALRNFLLFVKLNKQNRPDPIINAHIN